MKKKKKKPFGFDALLIAGLVFVFAVTIYLVYNSDKINKQPGQELSPTTTMVQQQKEKPFSIREPAVSGQFYPDKAVELEFMIKEYLAEAVPGKSQLRVRGLVSPHAGYVYSGPIAAYGYRQLANQSYSTIIILGPSHHVLLSGAAFDNVTHFKTPLGLIPISLKAEELAKEKIFTVNHEAHSQEHSIEVQLPFLQEVLKGNFTIIPIVTGDVDPQELASVLLKYIDDDTLVIASSDLSHYYPYDTAVALDSNCVKSIPNLDFSGMSKCEACGEIPILTLMWIAKKSGWGGVELNYRNSGDTAGTKDRVVGYMSAAFYENTTGVTTENQEFLLKLARETLEKYLTDASTPEVDVKQLSEDLSAERGCFVTLKKYGQLRGCIGHIIPQEPLYKCVIDNAVNAAVDDPRFRPTTYGELKEISIEISVLTVPKKLEYSSSDDLLNKLVPLRDGVVLKSGWHQATYLPQVWEQLPDKVDFLSSLCEKAGASSDCWRDTSTEISIYNAQVFGE
ncbi:MAG: AmmeMemoRadiSam system protein B [Candidatus Altiarchaeota archaeon]